MEQWKSIASKLIMVIFAGVLFFLVQTNTYAAAVGNKLTAPEAGWKRYDDTSAAIKYEGTWTARNSGSQNDPFVYLGTDHYTTSIGAKASFKFKGTKIRLLAQQYSGSSANITVNVDGTAYTYSAKATTNVGMVLLFERLDLTDAEHNVEIISNDTSWTEVDAIDINDTGYLINTPINLSAVAAIQKIDLSWTTITDATNYNVKRSITSGGPYETIAFNVTNATYTDINVTGDVKYYYEVIAVNATGEIISSNQAWAIPLGQPDTGHAILTVYLTNGSEKEYDLSMSEVNSFITWYENKQAGTGKASYAIDKHDNNKGPFTNRKDYVIFDKILTFSVDEYSAK